METRRTDWEVAVAGEAGLAEVVPLHGPRGGLAVSVEPRLTTRELAERWGVHTRSIERWRRERGLPFEQHFRNGAVRFVPSEVEAWWRGRSA